MEPLWNSTLEIPCSCLVVARSGSKWCKKYKKSVLVSVFPECFIWPLVYFGGKKPVFEHTKKILTVSKQH